MIGKSAPSPWQLAATLIAACAILFTASGKQQATAQTFGIGAHHTRCIVVFLDETGSDIGDWNAMREQIARIASRLKSDDAFTVIAINDQGGEAGSVRVPLSWLHAGPLETAKLRHQQDAIIAQVKSLNPIGHPRRTDIVDAIRQAMDIASKAQAMAKQTDPHANMDVILAFFSDMQQTPHMPKAAEMKGIQFPSGTKGYCFYVAAPGKNGIQSTVAVWKPLLNSADIAITDNDFHQQGTVDAAIDSVFRQ